MINLIHHNFFKSKDEKNQTQQGLRKCLEAEDYAEMLSIFNRIFSAMNYGDYRLVETRNNDFVLECFFRNAIFVFLIGAGFDVMCEDHSSQGRADIVMRNHGVTYVFEIKVSRTGTVSSIKKKLEDAMNQVLDGNYLGKHTSPVPVCLAIDGKLRRIVLASVHEDVYVSLPEDLKKRSPRFMRSMDHKAFLAMSEKDLQAFMPERVRYRIIDFFMGLIPKKLPT
jgi:hypothetical protein